MEVTTSTQALPSIVHAGRPRKWPDLLPGETGTYIQRKSIKARERHARNRAADVAAYNKYQMEQYHARMARRREAEARMAEMIATMKGLIG